jgi:hypothetical protein
VWEGEIAVALNGPALVIGRDGVTRRIRRGQYG